MKDGRAYTLLRRFVDVRPGEAGAVLRFTLQFSLIMASSYVILPLKISSFLKDLGARNLPLVYLLTAVLMSFVAAFNSRLLQRMDRRRYVLASQAFYILSLVLFWILFFLLKGQRWIAVAFWFWSDVFLATSVSQFWIQAGDYFSPRQARRFVGFIIGAGLLGGMAGSLAASIFRGDGLLLLCAGLLLIGIPLTSRAPLPTTGDPESEPEPAHGTRERVGYLQSLRTILGSRYLLLLSGMMLAATVVSKIIDFQFTNSLDLYNGGDKVKNTVFLGTFYTILLLVSYFLNALATSRILRRFGLRNAISIPPVVLALGSAAGFLIPGAAPLALLAWATLMRGTDKSLSHSVNQSTRELLYIPVPAATKYKAKIFIDLFISKFGDALAALFLLIASTILGVPIQALGVLTLAFVLVWLLLNHRLIREYVGIVKKNLALKWPDADKLVFDQIDVDATKLVFDTLESRRRSSVLYAMNLLDLIKKEKLSPELKAIIAQQSTVVRAGAFDGLLDAGADAAMADWGDALEDDDLDAQIQEVLSLDVYQQVMRERVEKIADTRSGEDVTAQMEVAKALGMMSADAPLVRNLGRLLKHESPEVVRYALESAGRQRKTEFVPLIVPHLGRSATREAAGQALLAYGDRIAGTLRDYLADPDEPAEVRTAVPGVLARIGSPRAASALIRELRKRDEIVQASVIEALARLRSLHPAAAIRPGDIEPEIFALIKRACAAVLDMARAPGRGTAASPRDDAAVRLVRTLKLVFGLLGLIYPQDDIARAYQNYTEGTKRSVDYSLELLEHLLAKDIKGALLPLLEERPLDEKAAVCAKILRSI
jgi:AAA family ATP:ADP antiporter